MIGNSTYRHRPRLSRSCGSTVPIQSIDQFNQLIGNKDRGHKIVLSQSGSSINPTNRLICIINRSVGMILKPKPHHSAHKISPVTPAIQLFSIPLQHPLTLRLLLPCPLSHISKDYGDDSSRYLRLPPFPIVPALLPRRYLIGDHSPCQCRHHPFPRVPSLGR